MKTPLEKLQALHEETHSHGNSHPTARDILTAATDFICTDLTEVIDAWHQRDMDMATLEIENEQLLKRLALYEKVAV